MKTTLKQSETLIQQGCVKVFRMQYPKFKNRLWSVPNGGKMHIATAKRMKAEGMTKGVPDLFLSVPRKGYGGMFIEMKTPKGTMSDEQKDFFAAHKGEYHCVVCRSIEEFMVDIAAYLR